MDETKLRPTVVSAGILNLGKIILSKINRNSYGLFSSVNCKHPETVIGLSRTATVSKIYKNRNTATAKRSCLASCSTLASVPLLGVVNATDDGRNLLITAVV